MRDATGDRCNGARLVRASRAAAGWWWWKLEQSIQGQ
jgi:hypothetical protein